ncbi:hypothetical protein F511_30696 [Dorcoceras hygrometricum]|uniref:Uncharacterized protein n=1 Tax=Dorcoceras hygrometricum TaxID=472368 RepID=A0A2Z7BMJ6_9LAMI|nr:hypothetical protein F511_30696 [Dorcoceras hygrometricum]
MGIMKCRHLERSGSACNISRFLSVDLYRVGYAEADVNAGQHPCSARRKRRRLASAKEPVDAHIRFPDVNAGQLFCSLQLVLREIALRTGVLWDPDHSSRRGSGRTEKQYRETINTIKTAYYDIHRAFKIATLLTTCAWLDRFRKENGTSREAAAAAACREEGPTDEHSFYLHHRDFIITPIVDQIGPIDSISKTECYDLKNHFSEPQCKMTVLPLNIGITDSACKNQLVVVSIRYGPFNAYIPIRSTTIGKSRVAVDPIAMRTSWRSNSDIASVTSIGYPRMSASGESSTTMHRLLHASGSHPIPPPDDPKTNQYNQDLGLIHSTNGNHLESPKEGSSIDHQVTIYLHAQNITMFPTNETWYFASQILVSSLGGLILILTAQSTRNMFKIHSDY